MVQCAHINLNGHQCKRNAQKGEKYCKQHAELHGESLIAQADDMMWVTQADGNVIDKFNIKYKYKTLRGANPLCKLLYLYYGIGMANKIVLNAIADRNLRMVQLLAPLVREDINVIEYNGARPLTMAMMVEAYDIVKFLVKECNADVNIKDNEDRVPLVMAVLAKNLEMVKFLVEEGNADVNVRGKGGNTPLITAVEYHSTKIVSYLLENDKIDANIRNNNGLTALIKAVHISNYPSLEVLVNSDKVDLNLQTNYGDTAMHMAMFKNDWNSFKMLMDKGADYKIQNANGELVLTIAAEKGSNKIIEYLLANGADINSQDRSGNTALIESIEHNKIETTRLLLDKGADINIETVKGRTALSEAFRYKNFELVKTLIFKGANVNGTETNRHLVLASNMGNMEIVQLLLSKGADINTIDSDGETVLTGAIERGNLEAVKFLLAKGANVNPDRGEPPLMLASTNGRPDIASVLISHGADVNATSENCFSPLFEAVNSENLELVKLLVANGADIDLQADDGDTVLHRAIEDGSIEIVKFLVDSGADVNLIGDHGNTPLILAAKYNNEELVRYLVNKGHADISIKNEAGKNAMKVTNNPDIRDFLAGIAVRRNKRLILKGESKISWMAICSRLGTRENMQTLRYIANSLNINTKGKSKRQICAALAESYEEYLALSEDHPVVKYIHSFTCENPDGDLLGTPWDEIREDDIFVDEKGYCFSSEELEGIRDGNHPFGLGIPMKDLKLKDGRNLLKEYEKRKKKGEKEKEEEKGEKESERYKKLREVHEERARHPTKDMMVQLVDMIDTHPMSGKRNYFDMNSLEPWEKKRTKDYRLFLERLKGQDFIHDRRNQLKTLYSPLSGLTFERFLTILIASINEIEDDDKQMLRIILIEMFGEEPNEEIDEDSDAGLPDSDLELLDEDSDDDGVGASWF